MFLKDYLNINGNRLNYYESGYGKTTIVFLSGFGTPFAIADMYELATLLQVKCRCVIIDRFGYGNSDIVNTERNLENICKEIKQVFKLLNIDPKKTILLGHSSANFYSMYINKDLKLKGLILIDLEKLTNVKLLFTKFIYSIYFLLTKTFMKKIFDNCVNKMFERSIPNEYKLEGKSIQKNKIPNKCIKDEMKWYCNELKNFENRIEKDSLSKALLVCRKNTFKYNVNIKDRFKEVKILNVGKAEHYIHYSHFYMIVKETLRYFEI